MKHFLAFHSVLDFPLFFYVHKMEMEVKVIRLKWFVQKQPQVCTTTIQLTEVKRYRCRVFPFFALKLRDLVKWKSPEAFAVQCHRSKCHLIFVHLFVQNVTNLHQKCHILSATGSKFPAAQRKSDPSLHTSDQHYRYCAAIVTYPMATINILTFWPFGT